MKELVILMKITPKAWIVKEISDNIRLEVENLIQSELQATYNTLIKKGVSEKLAKKIVEEAGRLI